MMFLIPISRDDMIRRAWKWEEKRTGKKVNHVGHFKCEWCEKEYPYRTATSHLSAMHKLEAHESKTHRHEVGERIERQMREEEERRRRIEPMLEFIRTAAIPDAVWEQ